MSKDSDPPGWHNRTIAHQVETPGLFQLGDSKEFTEPEGWLIGTTVHPEKPKGIGNPSYDPNACKEAGNHDENDQKFQCNGFGKRVLGSVQNT